MENITKLESTLWEMANNLRGSMDASEYKNYILGFMFYMFLSDKQEKYINDQGLLDLEPGETVNEAYVRLQEESEEDYSDLEDDLVTNLGYAIEPKNTWISLIERIKDGQVIPSTYQELFDSFNASTKRNPNSEQDFKGIFNDMNLGDSRLGTTTNDRARALGKIVDLVNSINIDEDSDQDVLGQVYEYLIGQFAASAGKKGGEFYTPYAVSKTMADIVTQDVEKNDQAFSVYDPACGSGSLLLTVGHALKGGERPGAVKYYGQELNTTTYNLARMNLIMHGVEYQNMHLNNGDTLRRDWPDGQDAEGIDRPRSFDAVVANPPYSAKWDAHESMIKDPRFKNYGKLAPKSKADFAFLLHGLYHLNNTGTMAIVLPHGVLFRGAAEGTIRKVLIEKNYIDTVIGLPANLFYGTSIPTIILILKKNKDDKNILFIDASQYFEKAKNKNIMTDADIKRIVDAYNNRKDIEKYAHLASIDEIKDNDYNLNIPRYVDTSDEEEEIDLQAVLAKIEEDDKKINELSDWINEQLKILGVTDKNIKL